MNNCNCEPKNISIGMGCCEPVLAPIQNYYTKWEVDRKIESAVTSGCCITPEEVDEKIEEAISGITVSGVTEEELNNAIASAKTEIEAEIPTVPTLVSAFENDVPYLKEHQSLSAYSTTEEMNEAISAATDGLATEGYVNAQISSQTADFVTGEELSSYTYDKATIDSKITSGGTFDPTQYYNKTATDELLAEKLDASAYTPCDLSNYYNKQEVDGIVSSAKTEIEAEIPSLSGYATEQWVLDKHYISGVDLSDYALKSEIPTVPTSNTAFTNDAGYLTEHQSLSGYATEQWVEDKHYITGVDLSDYALKSEIPIVPTSNTAFTNDAGYLTEHQSLSAYSTTDEVTSAITEATSGKANSSDVYLKSETSGATEIQNALNAKADPYSAGTGISIIDNVISATGGGGSEATVSALTCFKEAIPSGVEYTEGAITTFYVKYTGGGGYGTIGLNFQAYNNGVEELKYVNAQYNNGVFTSASTYDIGYKVTIENGDIKVVFDSGYSFKRVYSSDFGTFYKIEQYSSGTTSDVMVDTVYDTICRLSDKNLTNVIKQVYPSLGDGRLHLNSQGTIGSVNSSTEIASSTINTDGGKLNVHFSGATQHDAIINTGSGNYCELFSVYEYSKGKDDITMTINNAYTGSYTMTIFSISFVDTNNNTTYNFEFEYNITANTISTPSGYATYGTIVDTLSTDYKVKFLPNTGYKIASFRSNSCLIGGVDNTHTNDYITNLVTTTSFDYNGQEVIDDLYSKIPKIWCGTQSDYDLILNKDSETLYLIHE